MGTAKEIIGGWTAYLSGKNKEIALQRATHCIACEHCVSGTLARLIKERSIKDIQGMKCALCGCPLSAKLRSIESNCPLKKWE